MPVILRLAPAVRLAGDSRLAGSVNKAQTVTAIPLDLRFPARSGRWTSIPGAAKNGRITDLHVSARNGRGQRERITR